VQLTIQALCIVPLLLINGQPVLPKDDVIPHRHRKHRRRTGSDLPPTQTASLIQTQDRTRPLRYRTCCIQTSHTNFSTDFALNTVKWKSPIPTGMYLLHTALRYKVCKSLISTPSVSMLMTE